MPGTFQTPGVSFLTRRQAKNACETLCLIEGIRVAIRNFARPGDVARYQELRATGTCVANLPRDPAGRRLIPAPEQSGLMDPNPAETAAHSQG